MDIEEFVSKSLGEWKSMRSGHSLTFQQFEQVLSRVKVKMLSLQDNEVIDLLNKKVHSKSATSPFSVEWSAETDWDENNQIHSGKSILIPIPESESDGEILRSRGYSETVEVYSNYHFLDDKTFVLSTRYEQTLAEERIWFISDNVRCRSSVIRSYPSLGILQTSFASEVRIADIS